MYSNACLEMEWFTWIFLILKDFMKILLLITWLMYWEWNINWNIIFEEYYALIEIDDFVSHLIYDHDEHYEHDECGKQSNYLSRGSGEDLGNCCRRPLATVSQIFSTTSVQWFDCSPSSRKIITETLSTVCRYLLLTLGDLTFLDVINSFVRD